VSYVGLFTFPAGIFGCVFFIFLCSEVFVFCFMQGLGPYSTGIKKVEKEIKDMAKKVNDSCGM
jgi:hypothetical protein